MYIINNLYISIIIIYISIKRKCKGSFIENQHSTILYVPILLKRNNK